MRTTGWAGLAMGSESMNSGDAVIGYVSAYGESVVADYTLSSLSFSASSLSTANAFVCVHIRGGAARGVTRAVPPFLTGTHRGEATRLRNPAALTKRSLLDTGPAALRATGLTRDAIPGDAIDDAERVAD